MATSTQSTPVGTPTSRREYTRAKYLDRSDEQIARHLGVEPGTVAGYRYEMRLLRPGEEEGTDEFAGAAFPVDETQEVLRSLDWEDQDDPDFDGVTPDMADNMVAALWDTALWETDMAAMEATHEYVNLAIDNYRSIPFPVLPTADRTMLTDDEVTKVEDELRRFHRELSALPADAIADAESDFHNGDRAKSCREVLIHDGGDYDITASAVYQAVDAVIDCWQRTTSGAHDPLIMEAWNRLTDQLKPTQSPGEDNPSPHPAVHGPLFNWFAGMATDLVYAQLEAIRRYRKDLDYNIIQMSFIDEMSESVSA